MKTKENSDLNMETNAIGQKLEKIAAKASSAMNESHKKRIFGLIDMTTLDVADNDEKVDEWIKKVNHFSENYPGWPNVAALCVYPVFMPLMKKNLKAESVRKASVAGSFPSSQTYKEVKIKEVQMVLEKGADEIDIVLPLGKFFEEKYEEISEEIREIKSLTGDKHVKVILESGMMNNLEAVKKAAALSLESGADFIKTSTGKNGPGASPEAVYVMCKVIREFYQKTGKKYGIKPAGGISDAETAMQYYLIVEEVLGKEWLNPSLFRIGASRLANQLLGEDYF
ncbi:MAG: deoxyribose-phosphate aldolase [Bacteroidota bacterium]